MARIPIAQYEAFLAPIGVKTILILPHHPARNSAVERVVENVKEKLKR